jgi:hypothetical protein
MTHNTAKTQYKKKTSFQKTKQKNNTLEKEKRTQPVFARFSTRIVCCDRSERGSDTEKDHKY